MDDKRNIQLKCYSPEREFIRIKNNAKACDKTVSTYIRDMALDFNKIDVSYSEIEAHTQELIARREIIYRMIYTILKSGEYVPADLEYILERINDIYRSEKLLVQQIPRIKEEKARQVAIEARKIVRKYISKKW